VTFEFTSQLDEYYCDCIVFSDCIAIVFQPLVAAAEESPKVECSDGFTRKIVPLVAAWLGDREEHETVASLVKVKCIVLSFHVL
jgi:hypothetical protein